MKEKSDREKRPFLRWAFPWILIGLFLSLCIQSESSPNISLISSHNRSIKKNPQYFLREIHREVLELGSYPEENFIKREFFIDLDQNSDNKEEHVVILNKRENEIENMMVQITYFEPTLKGSIIRFAKDTREILCHLIGKEIEIRKCDFPENEMEFLLPKILEGIKIKKRLLKLIDHKKK